jgi:hypothetical protein
MTSHINLKNILKIPGMTMFNNNGHFKILTINGNKRRVKIETVNFATGIKLKMYDAGISQGFLSQDQVVQGMNFAAHTLISFNHSGKLAYVRLFQEQELLDGIKGKAGTYVHFFDTGGLLSVILSQDTVIGGIKFKPDTQVDFFRNGSIMHVSISRSHEILGKTYNAGSKIFFDGNGKADKSI